MATGSVIRHFTLDLEDLRWTGHDLAMPRLPTFRSPVPGLPMSHWR